MFLTADPKYIIAVLPMAIWAPIRLKTAISVNNLDSLYERQGKYDDAKWLGQLALAIREEVLAYTRKSKARYWS